MQRFLLIFISFILYFCSFPPLKIYPLAFISLVPLFMATRDLTKNRTFLIAILFFYVFWIYHTGWILNMEVDPSSKPWLVAGLLILPLYLSFFNALPFLTLKNQSRFILFPAVWTILEYLRGITYLGFPWVTIAYSQLENRYFRMLNAIGGIYFTGFLILLCNLLFFEFWETSKKKFLASFVLLLIVSHISGAWLYHRDESNSGNLKVLIFQPNILPREEDYSEWLETSRSYDKLISEVDDTFDLVILPESGLPGYFRYSKKSQTIINSLSAKTKAPVLLGSSDVDLNGKRKVYNTAFLVYGDSIISQYNKVHLVPFGEWLPYENKIEILRHIDFGQGDFSPGDSTVLLKVGNIPFGTLICFESIFPYITRDYSKKGAGFLVNITSDGWYGKSLGPKEHFELLRFRAIESDKYIARSAKTGISAIIDPKGRVMTSIGLFEWGYIADTIGIRYSETLYTKFGDFIIIISIIVVISVFIVSKRRKRRG